MEPPSLWQGLTAGVYNLLERHSDDVSGAGNPKRGVGDKLTAPVANVCYPCLKSP